MKVLAVSTWGTPCGIADYLAQAKPAIEAADPSISISPYPEALDPAVAVMRGGWVSDAADVLWLNYHRGLHSRWTPEVVSAYQQQTHAKVVITFHDTRGEDAPDALTLALHDLTDAFIVHERCVGLPKAILIRQGVAPSALRDGYHRYPWPAAVPILGTIGWNFPWKNYDRLAEVSAACGWALTICCNNAIPEDRARWEKLNPKLVMIPGFRTHTEIVSYLAGCDATIFPYECANSGTSGAVRLGLAARKPVIAWRDCRQFRDLVDAELNIGPLFEGIRWCGGFDRLPRELSRVPIQRVDPGIAHLANQDSWGNQGKKYAAVFKGLTHG